MKRINITHSQQLYFLSLMERVGRLGSENPTLEG